MSSLLGIVGSLIVLLIAIFVIIIAVFTPSSNVTLFESSSPLGIYHHAAVVSDAPGCAVYGRKILEKNGSAIDAAIATLLCMGVVVPESMGLGGGCMFVYYDRAKKTAHIIDGREKAPAKASRNMFSGNKYLAQAGGLSVAIPGELRAYEVAHKHFGKLPWAELFDGAIEISKKGFTIHEHFSSAIKKFAKKGLKGSPLGDLLTNPKTGKFYHTGDHHNREDLAKTFKILAEKGADEFYTGKMSKAVIKAVQDAGGLLTYEDLANYKPEMYLARRMHFNSSIMYTIDPPGGGLLLGYMLNVIENIPNMMKSPQNTEEWILFYHRMVEVYKHAYALRTYLEDRNFGQIDSVIHKLTSKKFAQKIAKRIDDNKTFEPEYYQDGIDVKVVDDHGTSHMSVIDKFGNAVAATSTINVYWGSRVLVKEYGIILNDEMDDFVSPNITNYFGVVPGDCIRNCIEPGKRPFSSMSPSILTDPDSGDVKLSIGAAGGTRIPSAMALVMVMNQIFKKTLKESIDAPRIHHQLYPNFIQYENNFSPQILAGLGKKGHKYIEEGVRAAVVNGVAQNEYGTLTTAYDYRKGGSVEGF